MAETAEILLKRLDERLQIAGKSRYWLSKQVTDGKNHGVVTDIERKGFLPAEPRLRRMAELLGTTTDYLMGRTDNPAQLLSEVTFRELPENLKDVSQPWRDSAPDGLPVLATGYCADLMLDDEGGDRIGIEQIQLEVDHTVTHIRRPAALWNARNAYAIYFQGSSMERRFYSGELGVVDPNRPPSPGHIVLVKLTDGEGDGTTVIKILVKELVRVSTSHVELLQYNPEVRFKVPRSQVVGIERVYRPDELLGL